MKNKNYLISSVSVGVITGLIFVLPAFAAVPASGQMGWGGNGGQRPGVFGQGQMMGKPAVFGDVEAISGDTLTVAEKSFGKNTATTTYSVDASNAIVMKGNATSSVSAIVAGDRIMVQGTLSGTNVTATKIEDGVMGRGGQRPNSEQAPGVQITGNGEPVVAGKVASINGSSMTVTNSGNSTYTIDTSSAAVVKNNATSSISNVVVGDEVIVQGSINGTSVIASSVIDQGVSNSAGHSGSGQPSKGGARGFFGSIGLFFKHLFGF